MIEHSCKFLWPGDLIGSIFKATWQASGHKFHYGVEMLKMEFSSDVPVSVLIPVITMHHHSSQYRGGNQINIK